MSKAAKIKNLHRLDVKNGILVLSYLLKSIFRRKANAREKEVYQYYNFLINCNGRLISCSKDYFIGKFEGKINQKIKLRRQPSSDLEVFKQIFISKSYAPLIEAFSSNYFTSSNKTITIIDCGANIGLSTLYFFRNFPLSRIICIEPEASNLQVMNFNLQPCQEITQINGGIWSHNVSLQISRTFRDQKEWSSTVKESEEENFSIVGISLISLIEQHQVHEIDILKLDIEGAEKEVFLSESANLDFLKITRCIGLEIHDEFKCRNEIYKILDAYNFSYFNHGELTIGLNGNLLKAQKRHNVEE